MISALVKKEPSPLPPDAKPENPIDATAEENLLAALDRSAERIETPCGNGRMVWRRWGAGPPLVLLHGGYGSWRHWVKTIPGLQGERTLYVPDLPSLGESDDAPAPGTPEAIAGIVGSGLDAIGIPDDALDLVGFSFGSLVGGHVAAQRSPLRSFTMVGPGAFGLKRNNIELLKIEPGMSVAEQREIHRTNLGRLMIADPTKIDELAITIQQANVARARIKSRRFSKTELAGDRAAPGPPAKAQRDLGRQGRGDGAPFRRTRRIAALHSSRRVDPHRSGCRPLGRVRGSHNLQCPAHTAARPPTLGGLGLYALKIFFI